MMRYRPTDAGGGAAKFLTLFVPLFLFYVGLAGNLSAFTVFTGAVSSAVVALVFAHIAFLAPPAAPSVVKRVARTALYLPYLFWEIVKANVYVAFLALHPSPPIDPVVGEYDPGELEPIPLTSLAVSVTLTPGTLVVDARDGVFFVHALTSEAFADLLEGRLARAVRFVFHGRGDRGDASDQSDANAGENAA